MSQGTFRLILRWIHIIVAIPILGYIYSPFEKLPQYAFPTRFVFFPIMLLSGLLMWKGHLLRRLIAKMSRLVFSEERRILYHSTFPRAEGGSTMDSFLTIRSRSCTHEKVADCPRRPCPASRPSLSPLRPRDARGPGLACWPIAPSFKLHTATSNTALQAMAFPSSPSTAQVVDTTRGSG